MAKLVAHAAKIPEAIQARGRDERMIAGDMVYVNVCDDLPWNKIPLLTPRSEVDVCRVCAYYVEQSRASRDGTIRRG